ncbi:Ribokinase-like protein [Geopyxis carbonaria]|nr:Ribokinase-like protein [Geopyxis carbonaria]
MPRSTPYSASSNDGIEFTTMGMFIIDEIHYGPVFNRKVAENIIGGAGTFGIIGARLFSPPPLSRRLGWIVDVGNDFPADCLTHLESLCTNLVLRETPDRKTTRGWNSYRGAHHREFRYLTPKKRLEAVDLIQAGFGAASCVHLICSPMRALSLQSEFSRNVEPNSQIIVWEPVPDLCTPEYRQQMLETARYIHVISPNSEELVGFFKDLEFPSLSCRMKIQLLASKIVDSGIAPSNGGAIVVRAGPDGCLIMCKKKDPLWLPAYYESTEVDGNNHPNVVDPTGGGNTFIGGLGVALVRSGGNVRLAAAFATVAASFAIEQIGIPVLEGYDASSEELWNGVKVMDRMNEYLQRIKGLGICLE